jgi:hypothetical protein
MKYGEVEFYARTINCFEEDGVKIIGVGSGYSDPDAFVIISRFDEGSVDESIGIQTHLTDYEVPGAIKGLSLDGDFFTIYINDNDQGSLKASGIRIFLAEVSDKSSIAQLEKSILDIFSGSSAQIILNT